MDEIEKILENLKKKTDEGKFDDKDANWLLQIVKILSNLDKDKYDECTIKILNIIADYNLPSNQVQSILSYILINFSLELNMPKDAFIIAISKQFEIEKRLHDVRNKR